MKVGLLTTSFPRTAEDPSGSFVLGFARALESRGHDVDVLAPEPAHGVAPRFEGVTLQWVPYLRPRSLQRTFYGAGVPDNLRLDPRAWLGLVPFQLQLARVARERARRDGWDALVSHWALPSALAAGLARDGRPHLAVFHSADLHLLERLPGRERIARTIAKGATSFLFVSSTHRERFLALLPAILRSHVASRAHVCPMGVPAAAPLAEPRRALRKRLGLDAFTLLSLGRLVPIKGIDHAIRAAARHEKVELLVAGEGPERGPLEDLARKTGARTRFLGLQTGDDKAALLAAADAFVLPSRPEPDGRDEGVPTALLEAMVAGLPIIASRTGGIPSVLRDEENALLVDPGDARALSAAIGRVSVDKNLRRRLQRMSRKDGALYTWPVLAPNLEALLADER